MPLGAILGQSIRNSFAMVRNVPHVATVSPPPVIVNGQNTVTNLISARGGFTG